MYACQVIINIDIKEQHNLYDNQASKIEETFRYEKIATLGFDNSAKNEKEVFFALHYINYFAINLLIAIIMIV